MLKQPLHPGNRYAQNHPLHHSGSVSGSVGGNDSVNGSMLSGHNSNSREGKCDIVFSH